jgi:iron complex outermembrane receptor protein
MPKPGNLGGAIVMKRNFGWQASLAAMLVAGALPTSAAWAQAQPAKANAEANSDNGDIIVTARKREESLQDIPVSITAVTGEGLASKGITNMQ